MISGTTQLIAHLGYPTAAFKAPMIYNPYFQAHGIDAVVVPMGCRPDAYARFLPEVTGLSNFLGALITMPHKVSTVAMLDEVSPTVAVSGACNAVRREADGRLVGDMFDGEGFVRGVARKGRTLSGSSALVIGSGGVGSAIAASLAKAGVARLGLLDTRPQSTDALATRLAHHYPSIEIALGTPTARGWDIIVNATPLGMQPDDDRPFDLSDVEASTLVADVVMAEQVTRFLAEARSKGCPIQIGTDMLFEQIPAYLEFFGLPSTTPDVLRSLAKF